MIRKLSLSKIEKGFVYYTNEDGDCTLKERPRELINRGVVKLFSSKQDRETIYALNSMTKLDIKWYGFLTALYIAMLLVAIPMSPHTVTILGTFQPAGILIFPITFTILDVINSTLRYEYAKTTTYIGAGVCFLAAILIAITLHVFNINGAYNEVFSPLVKLYFINSLCILTADQVNNTLFKKVRTRFYRAKIWQSSLISSIVGQAVYTVIWIGLFFNTSTSVTLIGKIVDNYSFKIGYAIALMPILYLLVATYSALKDKASSIE